MHQLCSQQMAGRLPGSDGERRAAQCIVSVLEAAGAEPLGDGYTDPFDAIVPELRATPTLEVLSPGKARSFEHLVDFCVNVQGAACGGSARAESVWLDTFEPSAPAAEAACGRIAVCSAIEAPAGAGLSAALEVYLSRLRRARDAGAIALLQVGAHTDRRKVMNHRRERPGLPSLDVSPRVVEAAFGTRGPGRAGRIGEAMAVEVPLQDQPVLSAGNVAARLGSGPVRLLLCAHYDHVGCLPDGRWFPGAADNASGVAVLLEAACALARHRQPGAVVVVLTSAEELGMLGAQRFAAQYAGFLRAGALVVNVDEIGGRATQPLSVMRTSDFPERVLGAQDRTCVGAELRFLPLSADGFADHVPLLQAGARRVAAVFSCDARHAHVHTLRDTPDRVPSERLAVAGRTILLIAHRALR
jgi:hypothetical protein